MSASPIGMLDSGVGGLSVLSEVRLLLPHENIIYVADQGHMPYGPRPRQQIRTFVENIAIYLRARGCKMLVIPCNAANAAALHHLRTIFPDWRIVGMEPAIKPAAERTRTGIIGVITTKATFQGELFASVIDRFARGVQVETQVCPDFVTLVEGDTLDREKTQEVVARYLTPMKEAGIDQLVIGCTHFPFLAAYIREFLGPDTEIVDPAPAVARQVQRVLESSALLNKAVETGTVEYLTSGDPVHFSQQIFRLTGARASASFLKLD